MLLIWEASSMIIKRLEIKELHGLYDYNVSFNDDLTFIYGENGCGKTTILDIVSSIVTGKIYKLSAYDFSTIVLTYKKAKERKLHKIKIESDGYAYMLSNNLGESEIIEIRDLQESGELYASTGDREYLFDRKFVDRYKFPRFLRDNFNYIYLPLGRNSQDGIDINEPAGLRRRRSSYSDKDFVNTNYLNNSLHYIEDIIRNGCMRINSAENMVGTRFRSNILTSSLKVNNDYNFKHLLSSVQHETTLPIIERSRAEYIKTLKSIGEWNDDIDKQVKTFFEKYRTAFEASQKDNPLGGVTIELLLMNMEFNRIQQIASQAQEIEKEKEKIRAPITTFLSTVNNFFCVGEDKKQIFIDDVGRITVEAKSPNRKLSLYNLSSGEKQIVIILGCLIFGLPAGESGVYIIDEPEASLHLAWQKIFVESIQKVNDSIQLIFATHAPEIIGRYTRQAVKLQKRISPLYKEKGDLFDE